MQLSVTRRTAFRPVWIKDHKWVGDTFGGYPLVSGRATEDNISEGQRSARRGIEEMTRIRMVWYET